MVAIKHKIWGTKYITWNKVVYDFWELLFIAVSYFAFTQCFSSEDPQMLSGPMDWTVKVYNENTFI